jgi:hypothetical protein
VSRNNSHPHRTWPPEPLAPAPVSLWSRLPDEPLPWYLRFIEYCQLGPRRSINAVARLHRPNHSLAPASGVWTRNARTWHWLERAQAWDEHYYHPNLTPSQLSDLHTRSERLASIDHLLDSTLAALVQALNQLDPATIPDHLPTLRQITRDLFLISHRERTRITVTATPPPPTPEEISHRLSRHDFIETYKWFKEQFNLPPDWEIDDPLPPDFGKKRPFDGVLTHRENFYKELAEERARTPHHSPNTE